jgi:lipoyl(octanoyl) transferase
VRPGLLLDLGVVRYGPAWELQRELVARRAAGLIPDTLVLLEHPPTYTLGRSGSAEHVLLDAAARARLGIELFEVDRGGDATYHGPGQLVGYPIVDLRSRGGDVHRYLREVEEILLRTLSDLGIDGERDAGYTGVWTAAGKVAQIGVKVSRGVTSHGFALNVDTDPEHWAGIVPCGLADRPVVSLAAVLGRAPDPADLRRRLVRHASAVFDLDLRTPGRRSLPVDLRRMLASVA